MLETYNHLVSLEIPSSKPKLIAQLERGEEPWREERKCPLDLCPVSLCCLGWSAVVRSQLTATSTSWVQAVLCLSLLISWDYRSLALSPGWNTVAWYQLTATSASWVQAIPLPQPPE
uniref:Zinc finger protein 875 n=1 Tax=Pongo abelii TaxID=9601 RepID=A0A8I5SYF7_PONAB